MLGMFDLQVVIQAVIYLILSVFGLAISIPVGLTVSQFENRCVLYTDVSWKNASYFQYDASSPILCNFSVGVTVFTCTLYGLSMGIYNLYAVCSTKDPNVGFNMWVMPFVLANSLVAILIFVISCIISVGLKKTCDGLTQGYGGVKMIKSCKDAEKINWNMNGHSHVNGSHFYSFLKAAEGAAWITFLLWATQVGLYILRFIRIRRYRAKDMGPPDLPSGSATPDDMGNFAAANPSA